MATVYEHKDGTFRRRNEYEVDDLTVEQAIDALIDPNNIDGKVTYSRDLIGWGDGAVEVIRDGEPYIIITA